MHNKVNFIIEVVINMITAFNRKYVGANLSLMRSLVCSSSCSNRSTWTLLWFSPVRLFSQKINESFKFPKHNEMFSQDNLGSTEIPEDPMENLGILRKYDRRRGVNAEELMIRDFKKSREALEDEINRTYSVNGKSDSQMMETTMNYISRARMGRDHSTGDDLKKERIQREYMNFGKYKDNYITQDDEYNDMDTGREVHHVKNYRDSMKRLDISNSEEERKLDLADTKNFMALYRKINSDSVKEMSNAEVAKDFKDDIAPTKLNMPRMSQHGRQRVYNDYKKGMTLRDISIKYGILPERVLAIVYLKEYFFRVVYPKTGETCARLAMKIENKYGERYGFWDYGIDLQQLSYHEQGFPMIHLCRSEIDVKPPEAVKKRIEEGLGKIKAKRVFEVPIKHTGGPKGYLLAELIWNRGKNSLKVDPKIIMGMCKSNKIRKMGY